MSKVSILPFVRQGLSQFITEKDNLSGNAGDNIRAKLSMNICFEGEVPAYLTEDKEKSKQISDSGVIEKKPSNFGWNHINHFEIIGAGDVVNIHKDAIRQVVPTSNGTPMSYTFMPYIEFDDADFPWRYTPLKENEVKLRPWIALVVCKADEFELEFTGMGLQLLKIKQDVVHDILPKISDLPFLAHAQQESVEDKVVEKFSRVFCYRELEPETSYTAFLIPTFKQGLVNVDKSVTTQESAWDADGNPKGNNFPIYYQWTFKTGGNNFLSLAKKIDGINNEDYSALQGGLNIDITETGIDYIESFSDSKEENVGIIPIQVALTKLNQQKEALSKEKQKMVDEQRERLHDLLKLNPVFTTNKADATKSLEHLENEDPWIVPPVYGARHLMSNSKDLDDKNSLISEINLNLENRMAAGMGAHIVQHNQEEFVHRAWEKVQKVNDTNQYIKELIASTQRDIVNEKRVLDHFQLPLTAKQEGIRSDAAMKIIAQGKVTKPVYFTKALEEKSTQGTVSDRLSAQIMQAKELADKNQGISQKELEEILDRKTWNDYFKDKDVEKRFPNSKMIVPQSKAISSLFVFDKERDDYIFETNNFDSKIGYQSKSKVTLKKADGSFLSILNYKDAEEALTNLRMNQDDIDYSISSFESAGYNKVSNYFGNNYRYVDCGKNSHGGIIVPQVEFDNLSRYSSKRSSDFYMIMSESKPFYIFNGGNISSLFNMFIFDHKLEMTDGKFVLEDSTLPDTEHISNIKSASKVLKAVFDLCISDYRPKNVSDFVYQCQKKAKFNYYSKTLYDPEKIEEVYEKFYKRVISCNNHKIELNSGITLKLSIINRNVYTQLVVLYAELNGKLDELFKLKFPINIKEYNYKDGNNLIFTLFNIFSTYLDSTEKLLSLMCYPTDITRDNIVNAREEQFTISAKQMKESFMAAIDYVSPKVVLETKDQPIIEPEQKKAPEQFANKLNNARLSVIAESIKDKDVSIDQIGEDEKERLWKMAHSKYPILAYPEFPDPIFYYLRELSERFVLPSGSALKQNTISTFLTNPVFMEAVMCGVNTEMGKELLWREYPTDERGSYFRKFWDKENYQKGDYDIKEVHEWTQKLGENGCDTRSQLLVFAIRAELMCAYPQTNVYISSYNFESKRFYTNTTTDADKVLEPEMIGWLSDEVYLAGFPIEKIKDMGENCCLIFEEESLGMCFYRDMDNNSVSLPTMFANSAKYAISRKVNPTIWGCDVSKIIDVTNIK